MEAVALTDCYWWEKPAANDEVRRGNHLVESDALGNTTTEYIWLGNQRLAMVQGGNVYFTHVDHLGTVQLLTDTNANVVWSADYKPFGEVNINPTSTIAYNMRFPGQYYDVETGNHYNYFRDYDPGIGRYNQSDPIGLGGGLNTYIYVSNNSVNASDSMGLKLCFNQGSYDSCAKSAQNKFDARLTIAQAHFNALLATLSVTANFCANNCYENSGLDISIRVGCLIGCAAILTIGTEAAASYMTGFIGGSALILAGDIAVCAASAAYEVDDCSNCD